ncbi:MAG: CPBP family intramembrane metalloprotease [Bacteroidia bacterium]|nr:CPBP family intramembrane metalloprotease [Bacteroidia bacterium]NNM24231.1 CPBP family intramembrane metalloprotease [Flavobacteriaceae bacterium]
MRPIIIPFVSVVVAVVVTATMDFTGYTNFSALPLLAITIISWIILKLSKKEIGLTLGRLKYYGLALSYPLLVLGATALIAYLSGGFSIQQGNMENDLLNFAFGVVIGPLAVLLTEEGFFRGWLWGALRRTGISSKITLFATSGIFIIWHVSAVISGSEYGLPYSQVPVYLVNVLLLGLIWGTMRWASGSIIVASVSHAVWNALAYGLFGYGEKIGLLGVNNTFLLGPEVGYLGIALNGLYFLWLWKITKKGRNSMQLS